MRAGPHAAANESALAAIINIYINRLTYDIAVGGKGLMRTRCVVELLSDAASF
jgi:hypothetical protein